MGQELARMGLVKLKSKVIGIFKNRLSGGFELVVGVNAENKSINTINITAFAAIQETYGTPMSYGQLEMFKEDKNLNEMLEKPMGWAEFMEQFKK